MAYVADLFLVFVEGLAIILSPCIYPILPLLLGTSATGSGYRPYAILGGFIISFTSFVFIARYLVAWFALEPSTIKEISLVVLGLFGLFLIIETASTKLAFIGQRLSQWGSKIMDKAENSQQHEIITGLVIGVAISLVWTPCAGPLLSVVLTQIIRQTDDGSAIFVVFSFILGASIPFLIIILSGRKMMRYLKWLPENNRLVKRILGGLIMVSSLLIATGVYAGQADTEQQKSKLIPVAYTPFGVPLNFAARDFVGINQWLNAPTPINVSSLKGKVAIVNFWTFSCYNCVNTLNAVVGWDKKYRDQGLVILSVHSPEFESDKSINSIQKAIKKHNIEYPVAVDNNLKTWDLYNNNCWPAFYFVNKKGLVTKAICGEHNYSITDQYIAQLLAE